MTWVLTGVLFLGMAAGASQAPVRVAVMPFEGRGARAAQAELMEVLGEVPGVTWVRAKGADPKAACADAGATLLLRGHALHKTEVHLTVLQCESGEPIDGFTLRLAHPAKLRGAIERHVRRWLSPPAPAEPAPPAEPEPPPIAEAPPAPPQDSPVAIPADPPVPKAPPAATAAVEPEVAPPSRAPSLEVSVGAGTVSRWLTYHQDLFGALSTYSLPAGPLLAGSLGAYPFALLGPGPLTHVGLIGQAQHSVAVSSAAGTGSQFPTTASLYAGGVRVRFWPGTSEVGLSAEGGAAGFDLSPATGSSPALPNYDYTFVSAAGDARIPISGAASLLARVGYTQVLSNSLAQSGYFPRATAGGVDGELGSAVALSDLFELRLLGEYRRYFFSMNPKPGDAHVAGGALDQYVCVTLQGAARFR